MGMYFAVMGLFCFVGLIRGHLVLAGAETVITLGMLIVYAIDRNNRHRELQRYIRNATDELEGVSHGDSPFPLVLARLAEPNQYLDSFKTILDNTAIRRYFFEADGTFIRKEEYSNCVLEYLQYVDEDAGVYPLTEDLMYIIRQHGDYAGWYDKDGQNYLFDGEEVLEGNGWMFLLCIFQ
jgi:hypothetical protein